MSDEEDDEVIEMEADEPIEDQLVAASEADLLVMARTLLAPNTHDAWSTLCRTRKLPPMIGETCERILVATLAQTWVALWRRGGTQPRPTLDGRRARGWQHAPAELEFSPTTMHLLRWLVATPLGAPASTLDRLPAESMTVGDQVLIYLALECASTTPAIGGIARQPLVRACPLAWVGFPHLFEETPPDKVDFDTLLHGAGAHVLEALGGEIGRRWFQVELGKRAVTSPDALLALGAAQDGVLERFMAACDKRRRRDLAMFILDAAQPSLSRNIAPLPAQLDPSTSLSTRTKARIAAGSLLRAIERWGGWDAEHRGIRFIDDEYASAQIMLARFERIGSAGVERAQLWLSELAALVPLVAPAPDPQTDATVVVP
jgi:hypothetical protein